MTLAKNYTYVENFQIIFIVDKKFVWNENGSRWPPEADPNQAKADKNQVFRVQPGYHRKTCLL